MKSLWRRHLADVSRIEILCHKNMNYPDLAQGLSPYYLAVLISLPQLFTFP